MKIKSNSKKRIIILSAASVLIATGLVVFALNHYNIFPFQAKQSTATEKIDLKNPTKDQVEAGSEAKSDFETRETEASVERSEANGTTETTQPSDTQVIISSSNFSDSTLSIRTILQTIDNSGECTLTVSESGTQLLTRSSGTQTMGSYSTCAGFDIDMSGFKSGSINLALKYTGPAGQSGTVTKTVDKQ